MRALSLAAEEDEPGADQKSRQYGCDVNANGQRGVEKRLERHVRRL